MAFITYLKMANIINDYHNILNINLNHNNNCYNIHNYDVNSLL